MGSKVFTSAARCLSRANLEACNEQRAKDQRMDELADPQPMDRERARPASEPRETTEKHWAESQKRQAGQPTQSPHESQEKNGQDFAQEEGPPSPHFLSQRGDTRGMNAELNVVDLVGREQPIHPPTIKAVRSSFPEAR